MSRHYLYPLNPKSKQKYRFIDALNNEHPTSVEGFLDCYSRGHAAEWVIHACASSLEPGDHIWVHFALPVSAIMAVGTVRALPHWRKDWDAHAIWIDWDWDLTEKLQRNPIPFSAHHQRALVGVTAVSAKTNLVLNKWMKSKAAPKPIPAITDVSFKLTEVYQRQGQSPFRRALMVAYDSTCAITGCQVREALQAAHIKPVAKGGRHALANGLLLRADIHNLFDLGLITVSKTYVVSVHQSLLGDPMYGTLNNKKLRKIPKIKSEQPSPIHLHNHQAKHRKKSS